jgi:hypothetical protein
MIVASGFPLADNSLKAPLRDGIYSIQTCIEKPVNEAIREYIDVVPNSVVFKVMWGKPRKIWSAVYLFPHLHIEKSGASSC